VNGTVTEAMRTRRSTRAFLAQPVARETVAEILGIAGQAPSGGNLQPWHVDVLAGEALADLKARVRASLAINPTGEGSTFPIYPSPLPEPWRGRRFESGESLYAAIGIPREDKGARLGQFARNFDLFGAPVGLFFSIDGIFGPPQWAHLGMYLQSIMLLAAERGLATCAQEAWAIVPRTMASVLALPEDRVFYCGMALGHADPDHPINRWRTDRVPLDQAATFRGF
jgi:nitroreductase